MPVSTSETAILIGMK